ncbi:MAG: hypothetical protein IKC69_07720 [Clostridia bacterium]|nr:hypothetical protein [Clostridia bacterium]
MLGYVKCSEGELRVKHHRLYGAAYCGLCHSVRVIGARALLPFFSYDFVFLALCRQLVTGEEMSLERDHCLLHPFRKNKMRLSHNRSLEHAAAVTLFLTMEKMQDDLLDGDSPFFRRLVLRLYLPLLRRSSRRFLRKHPDYEDLLHQMAASLREGRALEQKGASLDEMCGNFGACLKEAFSYGTTGNEARFLSALGDHLGRYLYTLDALDDREKDLKSGAFNPILKEHKLPDEETLYRLDQVLSFLVDEMKKVLDLVDGDEALLALCENIVCLGLPAAEKKIMKPNREMNNERSL